MAIFTVGHSNHSIESFLSLLNQHGVTAIADVRSSPSSQRFPHFNQAFLRKALRSEAISYAFLGEELGARPKDPACYQDGTAQYELIAATEAFAMGLERIFKGAKHHQIALMCAEQDPITCHRAILVCKHLKNSGLEIQHILKTGGLESHEDLEHRLLKLHKLSKVISLLETGAPIAASEMQLPLFNTNQFENSSSNHPPTSNMSLDDLIEQAYQLQGKKIAYTEKHDDPDIAHEQAS